MKNLLSSGRLLAFLLFNLTFLATLLQFAGNKNPLSVFDEENPVMSRDEEYDPSLIKLNSVSKLAGYCDSIYQSEYFNTKNQYKKNYTEVVASVIRKRFFHGYSHYSFENNYLAVLFSKITLSGYSAIVIPDDILKYPNAACSQQSIVMMEVLGKKGITTRKIGFNGKRSGHFSLEVYYNNGWHFYDTNMEPDAGLLNQYGRPSVASLSANSDLLLVAYNKYPGKIISELFSNHTYGSVNRFPAPRGFLFQKAAKVLSYTLWLFFLILFIVLHRLYLRYELISHVRNRRIYFPQTERETSAGYYPGITAPRS